MGDSAGSSPKTNDTPEVLVKIKDQPIVVPPPGGGIGEGAAKEGARKGAGKAGEGGAKGGT